MRTQTKVRPGGFTLIELSVVLVIIGLIVGGILAGQNLIAAAAVRAQITQIEKFNTAANTFYGKYGYLPGDITAVPAAQFGFAARGSLPGQGDGNGVLVGCPCSTNPASQLGFLEGYGETVMFWQDLSQVNLIEGNFTAASSTTAPSVTITSTSTPSVDAYLPQAKLGNGNYVYAYSGGLRDLNIQAAAVKGVQADNTNYFGVSQFQKINTLLYSNPGMTVAQAYAIDSKMDDGMPQSGRVTAFYLNTTGSFYARWATGTPGAISGDYDGNTLGAITAGTTNPIWDSGTASQVCFSNGQTLTPEQYNLAYPNNVNCSLSFRFQ